MPSKILLGVQHSSEPGEFQSVATRIDNYFHANRLQSLLPWAPKRQLGLELPKDYLEKEKFRIVTHFFGPLAQYFRSKKIDIVPLEENDAWKYSQAIEFAKNVQNGIISKNKVQNELRRVQTILASADAMYWPLEKIFPLHYQAEQYKTALDILEGWGTEAKIAQVDKDSASAREKHVLDEIVRQRPAMVVIGDGHARVLQEKLQAYGYRYEKMAKNS